MSEKNIFDVLNTDLEDIDENTLLEDTGINYENVRNKVMKEIQSQQPKKKIKKKVIISLIAAILAITALSVTSVATGDFNRVFGEIISGECVDGFYSGGNVTVSCNENYKVEVLGIAGDDNNSYTALKITNADGTPFAKTENKTIVYAAYNNNISTPWLSNESGTGSSNMEGCIQDDGSILLYLYEERDTSMKGQRLTLHIDQLEIYDYRSTGVTYPSNCEEEDKNFDDRYIEEYGIEENEWVMINSISDDEVNIGIMTKSQTIELNADIALDLNYRSTTKDFKTENSTIASGIKSATLSNFSLTIKSTGLWTKNGTIQKIDIEECNNATLDNRLRNDDENINGIYEAVITMKNGDTFYGYSTLSGCEMDGYTEFTLIYQFYKNKYFMPGIENMQIIAINPAEVATITINNCTFIPA